MNIFKTIEEIVPKMEGWCSVEKALTLASMVIAHRPQLCVEIGVWHGRSIIPVGLAMKHIGTGRAIGIDPWDAKSSVSHGQLRGEEDREWWDDQRKHDIAYAKCMENILKFSLGETIIIERKNSDDVMPPSNIGILHIDGNHGEMAVKDIKRYGVKISVGGYMIIDDINWSTGDVMNGVNQLSDMGFKQLYSVTNELNDWAVFQRLCNYSC